MTPNKSRTKTKTERILLEQKVKCAEIVSKKLHGVCQETKNERMNGIDLKTVTQSAVALMNQELLELYSKNRKLKLVLYRATVQMYAIDLEEAKKIIPEDEWHRGNNEEMIKNFIRSKDLVKAYDELIFVWLKELANSIYKCYDREKQNQDSIDELIKRIKVDSWPLYQNELKNIENTRQYFLAINKAFIIPGDEEHNSFAPAS